MRLSDFLLVLLLVMSAASGDEEDTEKPLDSSREAREYLSEGWRAVEVIPEGASGWIPHDLTADQTYSIPMKRRRLKKRRKRPQVIMETVETISEETIPKQRPMRPQKVEERPLLTKNEAQTIKAHQGKGGNQRRKTRPLEQERRHVVDNENLDKVMNTKPNMEEENQKGLHVSQHVQLSQYRQRPQKGDQNHDEPNLADSKGQKIKTLPQRVVDDRDESEELPAIPRRKQVSQKLDQEQVTNQHHRISTAPEKEAHDSENKDDRGTFRIQSQERHQENEETSPNQRRKIRPQRLDQVDESWEEMKDEMNARPNIRRRLPPSYQFSSEEATSVFKSAEEGDNYGPKQTSRLPNEDKDSALADLKSLLKKSQGSISLSEILQQKNLSLTEVLNGNQKAISALTEKPVEATEPIPTKALEAEQSTKYKRLPPSIALRKNTNKIEDNGETLSTRELQEAQKRRTVILQNHKENKIFSTVTKMDVVTEALTEKRIFVPSHPKLYTSLNYKPDFATYFELSTESITNEIETTTPTSTTSTPKDTTTGRMHLIPKSKSPKVKITIKPHRNGEVNLMTSTFPKPIKIDISEVLGFKEETDKLKDEPLRMPIDLEMFMDRTTNRIDEPTQKSITVSTSKYLEEPVYSEKLSHVTAKDEISEILKDQRDRERLAKILESRNMTLEELVEQRERGSSQLHLADIFHNKTKEPKPIGEPHTGRIMSNLVHSFPVFNTPKALESNHDRALPQLGNVHSKQGSIFEHSIIPEIVEGISVNNKPEGAMFLGNIISKSADATHIEMHRGKLLPDVIPAFTRKQKSYGVEVSTEPPTSAKTVLEAPNAMKVEGFQNNVASSAKVVETDKNPIHKDVSQDFPVSKLDIVNSLSWQKVYPELFPELYGAKDARDDTFITAPPVNLDEALQRLEETDDSSAVSSKERFLVNRFDNQAFINVPSGVKSVLIVSFSIIGLSILVFLTILMVFRWLQKQRRKLNYCGSLSSKLRSPMLMQGSPTAAIKTFMNETLGRRKHYYKSNVHCMTDDTWECDRERTPSF